MTTQHKLFSALVVQGALLGGCFEENSTNTPATDDSQDTAANDTGTQDTAANDTGVCADAVCEETDDWTLCLADGVQCCWATGECCDSCCGHLAP